METIRCSVITKAAQYERRTKRNICRLGMDGIGKDSERRLSKRKLHTGSPSGLDEDERGAGAPAAATDGVFGGKGRGGSSRVKSNDFSENEVNRHARGEGPNQACIQCVSMWSAVVSASPNTLKSILSPTLYYSQVHHFSPSEQHQPVDDMVPGYQCHHH